jgi:hypothetical protein
MDSDKRSKIEVLLRMLLGKRFDDPLKDLGLTPFGIARA